MTLVEDTIMTALCVIADAHHGAENADYAIHSPYQLRYAWALNVVRQVARRDLSGLDETLRQSHD